MTLPASTRDQRTHARDRMVRRGGFAATGLAAAALVLTACGGSSSTATNAPPSSSPAAVVATGALLSTGSSSAGTILMDGRGHAVYMFSADTPGHSACTGACLTTWPLVPAPATLPSSLPGVTAKLGVLNRPDGSKQLMVDGHPVYTYAADTVPGAVNGQGANLSGGLWWVIAPDGSVVKTTAGSSPSPTPTVSPSKSTTSGGGAWG